MAKRSSYLPLGWIDLACALAVIAVGLLIAIAPPLAPQSPLAVVDNGIERFPISRIGVMPEGELA